MSRKKRKKQHGEHGASEAWLLPYSDLMTLLLAVFIVLFAVSNIDKNKAEAMSKAFGAIFQGGSGILDGTGDKILDDGPPPPIDLPIDPPIDPSNDPPIDPGLEQINALDEALRTYIEENSKTGEFDISSNPEMITITLASDILFPSGEAELNDAEKITAQHLADIVYKAQELNYTFQVQVSGHTDNIPVDYIRYASNWELSLDRASSFMAAMLNGSQLDPRAFSAVGHGELDPVASNDTEEGRAKNRRVEIKIISQEDLQIQGGDIDD